MQIESNTFDTCTGYGKWSRSIVHCFESLGHKVTIACGLSVPDDLKYLVRQSKPDILISPPYISRDAPIQFTTYESDRLPEIAVKNLKKKKKVVVLCELDKEVCAKHSIKAEVCHPGVSPRFLDVPPLKPFVFIHVGADSGVPERKRTGDVIKAFLKAFPVESDVRLIIKKEARDRRVPCFDTRIEAIYEDLPSVQPLYEKAHVGVFPCGQEGWGYCHSELMALGRPVICPHYGGPADFCDEGNSYSLPYHMVKVSKPTYQGIGYCARVNLKDIATRMRWCYDNKEDTILKGVHAYRNMTRFTLQNMARRLSEIL